MILINFKKFHESNPTNRSTANQQMSQITRNPIFKDFLLLKMKIAEANCNLEFWLKQVL